MKPLYFPFTTISEPVLGALLACFKQVAVYQPSRNDIPESLRNWETRGRLQIRLPDEDENDPLPHLLKAYHAWAELHEGERPDFEKYRPPLSPFTDSSATSRIRSDIRKATERTETTLSQEDRERSMLLRARLFLTVAQEHDQLRQTLRKDLSKIGDMEKNLYRNLLTDQDEPFSAGSLNRSIEATENERYMPGTRMTAWAQFHVHHRKSINAGTAPISEAPDFLITSDQFALDRLLEQSDEADTICSVSGVPFGSAADLSGDVFFNEQRYEKLMKLATGTDRSIGWDAFFSDTGSGFDNTGRLTIYRIKGDAIVSLLSKSANYPEPSRKHQDAVEKQYTLVGKTIRDAL